MKTEDEIKKALKEIGFVEDGKYFIKDGCSVKVHPRCDLPNIFNQLIRFGSTQRVWKIQRALEIN